MKCSLKNLGANKTLLIYPNGFEQFFSYETCVACFSPSDKTHFRTSKKWSVTTSKHITQYLRESEAENVKEKEQEFFDNLQIGE